MPQAFPASIDAAVLVEAGPAERQASRIKVRGSPGMKGVWTSALKELGPFFRPSHREFPAPAEPHPVVFLDDYVEQAIDRPWGWGGADGEDCCFFAGNWVRAATGRDPLGPYRGLYSDVRGAARLIRKRGGLVAMVGAEMERCGFRPTGTPEHGDVGAVEMPVPDAGEHDRIALAIRSGPWWVGKTREGFACVRCDALAAWKVLP